jgi:two-component system nitrate/nitrite response regulator NarL
VQRAGHFPDAAPRCLIVDDHAAIVRALSELLAQSGFAIAATASSAADALALAADDPPDCAVVDCRLPDLDAPQLLARLRSAAPEAALVVYTGEASAAAVDEALAAGAGAIVLKEAPLAEVVRALESALRRVPYLDPRLAALRPVDPAPALSGRETEVLALVADGLQYAEIARRLGIGVETCRSHVKNATRRLGATTRTAAVARALRAGLIG